MIRVGILRGGAGKNYEASLANGALVLKALPRDRFLPVDIFVDAAGVWHVAGRAVSAANIGERVDVLWDMLHLSEEDERLAADIRASGLPRIGAKPQAVRYAEHKKESKDKLAELGIRTPRGVYIESWGEGEREETVGSVTREIARQFSPPWIVEPMHRQHALAPVRAKTRHELADILSDMFDSATPVLVEEEVLGKRSSVIVVPGFRKQKMYTFLPSGHAAGRDPKSREALERAARAAHAGLDLGHYSCIEAVVTKKGDAHIVNIEVSPSLAPDSDLHEALAAVGATFSELAEHLLRNA